MLVMSNDEMNKLQSLGRNKRREKLRKIFLSECYDIDIKQEALEDFYNQGFDAAITLPSIQDKELLNLCRIGLIKRAHVKGLNEFERCQNEERWSGRSLYLSYRVEVLSSA